MPLKIVFFEAPKLVSTKTLLLKQRYRRRQGNYGIMLRHDICCLLFGHHLSGPVLRDTARLSQRYPPIARYGVFGVSTWPIGCDTPSPFSERFPLGVHAK